MAQEALTRIGHGHDADALARMSSQAVMAHPLHWMRLVGSRDPSIVITGGLEPIFFYGCWGDGTGKVSLVVQKQLSATLTKTTPFKELHKIRVVVSVEFYPRRIAEFSWHME